MDEYIKCEVTVGILKMSVTAPISKTFSKTIKSQHLNKAWLQFDLMRREVLVAENI